MTAATDTAAMYLFIGCITFLVNVINYRSRARKNKPDSTILDHRDSMLSHSPVAIRHFTNQFLDKPSTRKEHISHVALVSKSVKSQETYRKLSALSV